MNEQCRQFAQIWNITRLVGRLHELVGINFVNAAIAPAVLMIRLYLMIIIYAI
jgi:hypothetical protein